MNDRVLGFLKKPFAFTFVYLLFAGFILFFVYLFFLQQRDAVYQNKMTELHSIAYLKLSQINQWREERIVNAKTISENSLLIDELQNWTRTRSKKMEADLLSWLKTLLLNKNYTDAAILDVNGRALLATYENYTIGSHAMQLAERCKKSRQPALSDLHQRSGSSPIHIDMMIPLYEEADTAKNLIAFIFLRVNPYYFLYPQINDWPVPSRSAETILARIEHDSILFLNQTHFQPSAALKYKIPLAGNIQMVNDSIAGGDAPDAGTDYRGASVLMHSSKIPGTNWYLISKIDRTDIFDELFLNTLIIALVILGAITSGGILLHRFLTRKDIQHRLQMEKSETEKLALTKHFEFLVKYANDIILLLDERHRIVYANDKAVETYGYSTSELLQMEINDIRITNERTKTRTHLGFSASDDSNRFETVHRRKDGSTFPVDVSVHKMMIEDKLYVQGIIRDVSQLKANESRIIQLNRIYSLIMNVNQVIVRTNDRQTLLQEICRISVQEGKFFAVWIGQLNGSNVEIAEFFGLDKGFIESRILHLINSVPEESFTLSVAKDWQKIIINNVAEEVRSERWRQLETDLGINSLAIYPLQITSSQKGAIYFYCSTPYFFNEEEIQLIDELIADIEHALVMLETEQMKKEVEKNLLLRGNQMEQLARSSRKINTVLEIPVILRSLVASALELTQSQGGAAGLMRNGRMEFTEYQKGTESIPIEYSFDAGVGVPGHVMNTLQPYISNDTLNDSHVIQEIRQILGFTTLINVPIIDRVGTLIGCFEMHNKANGMPFTGTDIMLMEGLAASAAVAFENARMLEGLNLAEQAVRISERQLRASLENSKHVAIQWYDDQAQVLYWNPASELMFGWSAAEAIGRTLDELILSKEEAKEFSAILQTIQNTNRPYGPYETKIRRRDGKIISTLSTLFGIPGDHGKQIFVAMDIDITFRKRAEERIRLNELKLQSLLKIHEFQSDSAETILEYALREIIKLTESSIGCIYLYDEKTHRLSLSASRIETPSEPNANNSTVFLDLDSAGVLSEAIKQRKECIYNDFANEYLDQHGFSSHTPPPIRFLTSPVLDNNKVVAVVGIGNKESEYDYSDAQQVKILMSTVWKIVQRKADNEKVRQLSHIVEQSPVSIIITDINGNIEYLNPKCEEITGYLKEELIGQNPRVFKSGETPGGIYTELWETIRAGDVWFGEFHNKRKNGELFWELASISPLTNEEGFITHFVAVKEDITEIKKAEQELIAAKEKAEEMDAVKSAFLANMSHELRTPMIGIQGYAEILAEELLDPSLQVMVKAIQTSSARLLETLSLILNLSRMKADKVEVNNEHVNLVPLIGKFVEGFRDSAANKNLELLYECSVDAIDVFIDTAILKQIVNNLINNAIKFTPAGGVIVSLNLLKQNALESIVLKVKDTGIGISDEHQSIIWDEFRQVSEGMSRVFEGAGLGLTITKMFVEKLGGRISVQSKLGVGTEFTVILQSSGETAPGKQPAGSIIPSATKQSTAARPSILMVEDDKISIDLIQMFLGRDYEMVVAKDGKTALALVKEKKYDAILMDINLGHGMSGVDVTRAIRQLAEYQSVPIVAVTAYAMDGDRNEFINAGCTHYISKPFSRKEFLRLISGLFT